MQNLNATGGTPIQRLGFTLYADDPADVEEPAIETAFGAVRADSWEGGRARRCEFLRGLGEALVI